MAPMHRATSDPPHETPPSVLQPTSVSTGEGLPAAAPALRADGWDAEAAEPVDSRLPGGVSHSAVQVLEAEVIALLARVPARMLALHFLGAVGMACLALALSSTPTYIPMMWYPNTWGACFLLVAPRRMWPAVLISQGLAIAGAGLLFDHPGPISATFALAGALESAFAAALLRASGVYQRVQDGPRPCAGLLLQGAVLPALAGAVLGGLVLAWLAGGPWYLVALTWFTSSLLGSVSLLPLGVTLLATPRGQLGRRLGSPELPMFALATFGGTVVALVLLPFPFVYLVLPLVVAAVTLPFVAVAALVFGVSLVVALLLALTLVPLPAWTADWQPVLLYLPLLAALVPPLLLSASVSEARFHQRVLARSRDRQRSLYERTPAMMMSLGPDGRLVGVSELWLERLGYRRDEVIGRHGTDFLDEPSRRRAFGEDRAALLMQRECRDVEYGLITRDGRHIHVLFSATCEYDDDGRLVRIQAVLEDVTRKRLAERLALEHARSRVTLESVADAVVTTDASGHIEYMNPVACVMTGWSAADACGRTYGELFSRQEPSGGADLPDPVAACLQVRDRPVLPYTVMLRNRHGMRHAIHESVAPMFDAAGELVGTVVTFQDVTQAYDLAMRLAHQAQHDVLTGLPNRLLLRDRLQQCLQLARRNGTLFALLFMDLDHFKQINDRLGHAAGDDLLRQVAQRIVTSLRSSDTACRLGGDEFVVLLPRIDRTEDAGAAAAHLLDEVSQPYLLAGTSVTTTFSIGIAIHPNDGEDDELLMRHADAAMYRAKRSGRNQYCFHHAP